MPGDDVGSFLAERFERRLRLRDERVVRSLHRGAIADFFLPCRSLRGAALLRDAKSFLPRRFGRLVTAQFPRHTVRVVFYSNDGDVRRARGDARGGVVTLVRRRAVHLRERRDVFSLLLGERGVRSLILGLGSGCALLVEGFV